MLFSLSCYALPLIEYYNLRDCVNKQIYATATLRPFAHFPNLQHSSSYAGATHSIERYTQYASHRFRLIANAVIRAALL